MPSPLAATKILAASQVKVDRAQILQMAISHKAPATYPILLSSRTSLVASLGRRCVFHLHICLSLYILCLHGHLDVNAFPMDCVVLPVHLSVEFTGHRCVLFLFDGLPCFYLILSYPSRAVLSSHVPFCMAFSSWNFGIGWEVSFFVCVSFFRLVRYFSTVVARDLHGRIADFIS